MNWLVTRHPGALEWMAARVPQPYQHVGHLDVNTIRAGDTVYGTLPMEMAAHVHSVGARYAHLAVQLPEALRGQELSAMQLDQLSAQLIWCTVITQERVPILGEIH